MAVIREREELFENILRLRRIGRRLPGDGDVAQVRIALERALGPTVSVRTAARLLGVTHPAVLRWIDSGDLPVVETAGGRNAVPVPALLQLRERFEEEAQHERYRLTSTMRSQRRAADAWQADGGVAHGEGGHDRARRRALAYHQAVARGLRRSMVVEAQHVLERWLAEENIDRRHAERWQATLAGTIPEIRHAIVASDPEADDLRQNSPFAGMLSEPERRRIIETVR
jgi:excisionase family DNA binding protein